MYSYNEISDMKIPGSNLEQNVIKDAFTIVVQTSYLRF